LELLGLRQTTEEYRGKHRLLDTLTSLALEYKRRSKFFTTQLENYILLAKRAGFKSLFTIYWSIWGGFLEMGPIYGQNSFGKVMQKNFGAGMGV